LDFGVFDIKEKREDFENFVVEDNKKSRKHYQKPEYFKNTSHKMVQNNHLLMEFI